MRYRSVRSSHTISLIAKTVSLPDLFHDALERQRVAACGGVWRRVVAW